MHKERGQAKELDSKRQNTATMRACGLRSVVVVKRKEDTAKRKG